MLNSLEEILSAERLGTYISLADGDREYAIRLYLWNVELSESLQLPVHVFEVAIRNAIHKELSRSYGANWYDHPTFPITPSAKTKIRQVKRNLTFERKFITPPHVIAGLTMGFWTSLLTKHYDMPLWRTYLHNIFTEAPQPFDRSMAHSTLNKIRIIRNRIAHHEPILSKQPQQIYYLILETTSWISPDTAQWVSHHCRFNKVWTNRPII